MKDALRRLQQGEKLRWSIHICTPKPESLGWGDTDYAESFARALRRRGHTCRIRFWTQWEEPLRDVDVALVMTGLKQYRIVDGDHLNLVWVISHPELRSPAELIDYDAAFIASEIFSQTVAADLPLPVFHLPQGTDPERFNPAANPGIQDMDILFVGNNYYDNFNHRKIIKDLLDTGQSYDYYVVGNRWERGVPENRILSRFVPYDEVPALYSRARINLNDHHELMRRYGFVNNRTYDLAALKAMQISDPVPGIDRLGVITYADPDDLREKLDHYLSDEADRKRNAEIVHRLCKSYTFDTLADLMMTRLMNM